MANSYNIYPGDGTQTDFAVPFPFIFKTHVFVTVSGVAAAFTWPNPATVRVSPAPVNGASIRVYRRTPSNGPLATFQNGAALSEEDLNIAVLQAFYIAQETADLADEQLAEATSSAQAAIDTASNAQDVADGAAAQAAAAVSQVSGAVTAASAASALAATANTNAANAVSAASAASTTAQEALDTANEALTTIGPTTADQLDYDNSESGIAATNVQDAIDVIAAATGVIDQTSDTVANVSDVSGTTVSAALETLAGQITAKLTTPGTAKATPVDADRVAILDSAASLAPKYTLWSAIKSTLKTYFDTVYAAVSHTHSIAQVTSLQGSLDGKEPANANLLKGNASATVTGGYAWGAVQADAISAGAYTPSFATGNVKSLNNNGAFTLNPPASGYGVILLTITNVAGAGIITAAAGFDAVEGDSFDVTVGSVFLCQIVVASGLKMLVVTKK